MGLRMENSNMGGHWKIQFSGRGGSQKKTIYRGKLPKKVAWTVCRWGGGGAAKKKGWCFRGAVLISHSTLWWLVVFEFTLFVPSILLFNYILYFLFSDWVGHILTWDFCIHIFEGLVGRSLEFCFLNLIKSMFFNQKDLKWTEILIVKFSGNPADINWLQWYDMI